MVELLGGVSVRNWAYPVKFFFGKQNMLSPFKDKSLFKATTCGINIYSRTPSVTHANHMKQKSSSRVLKVDMQDPNSTHGITEVMKNIMEYVPEVSDCGRVHKKTVIFGTSEYRVQSTEYRVQSTEYRV